MYRIGIDFGGSSTKVALVSSGGSVLSWRKLPRREGESAEDALSAVATEIRLMAHEAGFTFPPGGRAGIGVPGLGDHKSGRLEFSGPLGWRGVDLADLAQRVLGCPAVVDTDVNAGALADLYFGCGREAQDLLYVSWGTGIGAAFAPRRKLYHSRGGTMCNLGHSLADPSSDRECYCGIRGCLEIEAGGKALVRRAAGRMLSPKAIAEAAAEGDALAHEILEAAAILMARALSGVLAFLNPDTVVFGGGVSQCFPLIEVAFRKELELRTPEFALRGTRIVTSRFGAKAGAIGAAMLGINLEVE